MIYVLHVQTGKEMAIRDELRRGFYGAMVPREITPERKDGKFVWRERVLFPGYVFVDMALDLKSYYKIRGIPHVIRFLGDGKPVELPSSEATYIVWLAGNGKPLQPSILDDATAVISGPLKGRESSIASVNKRAKRARVKVSIAGEVHEVSLSVITEEDAAAVADDNR